MTGAARSNPVVEAVRRFNRFYTHRIGVLNEGMLESPWSLTQVRVLYEIAHRDKPAATDVGAELGLDAGYLSRLLADLQRRGLIRREPSTADGRRHLLSLTGKGRKTFGPLEERSNEQVAAMLAKLSRSEKKRLLGAMGTIEGLLGERREPEAPYVLRPHQPGDMGWVVHRHGALYAQEYGWDETFEALVAEIAARFIRNFDPARERCWIAEREGEIVGSVFLVRKSEKVAKLRMLLVEPSARGLGLGARLVGECLRFARSAGYRKVTLWTQSVLHAARHIYEKEGFRLVASKPNESFGHSLVAETWELEL